MEQVCSWPQTQLEPCMEITTLPHVLLSVQWPDAGKKHCEYCYFNDTRITPLFQRVMAHGLVLEALVLSTSSKMSVHPCRQCGFYFVYSGISYCFPNIFYCIPPKSCINFVNLASKHALSSLVFPPPCPYSIFCMCLWKLGHELQIINLTVLNWSELSKTNYSLKVYGWLWITGTSESFPVLPLDNS